MFCFITSNSWLDAGYGKDLQRFLLTRGKVRLVIDNQARRSFASAEINTVIVLLGAAQDGSVKRVARAEHLARFLMLTVPFEQVLSPVIWGEVDEAISRRTTPEYRVSPQSQIELLDSGTYPEMKHYAGDKWGGKYLRAPDIFFTVFEKGREKLVRLAEIIKVETYLNTGGADGFFIVRGTDKTVQGDAARIQTTTGEVFEVEAEWLRPFIKSPSELKRIFIQKEYANWLLVIPPLEVETTSLIWRYIKWGEQQGYSNRSGCRKRSPWWKLPSQATSPGTVIWSRLHDAKHLVGYNPGKISYTNFYALHCSKPKVAVAMLNSSLLAFAKELMGKTNFGGGALKTDGNDIKMIPCIDVGQLTQEEDHRLLSALDTLGERDIGPVREEIEADDRQSLDAVIFDVIGLTQGERDAIYEELVGLIERRREKAGSL